MQTSGIWAFMSLMFRVHHINLHFFVIYFKIIIIHAMLQSYRQPPEHYQQSPVCLFLCGMKAKHLPFDLYFKVLQGPDNLQIRYFRNFIIYQNGIPKTTFFIGTEQYQQARLFKNLILFGAHLTFFLFLNKKVIQKIQLLGQMHLILRVSLSTNDPPFFKNLAE